MVENQQTAKFVQFQGDDFKLVEGPIPKPKAGEVLIKNAFSTVNPVDGYFMAVKKDGSTVGSEGSGTIIEVGEGVSHDLVGQKVGFVHEAWATHNIKNVAKDCLIHVDPSVNLESVANSIINPLTVCAQLDFAKKLNAKSVIMLAASSQLAK